jgi:hypothetical protein
MSLSERKTKKMNSPVSVDLTIPRLLLHVQECTHLHDAGKTGIQKD